MRFLFRGAPHVSEGSAYFIVLFSVWPRGPRVRSGLKCLFASFVALHVQALVSLSFE